MRMTTVRGPGAVNSARTGTTRRPVTRKETSTTNASSSGPCGGRATVRSANEYGWNHEPCHGSSRLATTSCGSHRPTAVNTVSTALPASGRTGTIGRSDGSSSPTASSRTHTSTPSSWTGYGSQPANGAPSRASPCQWHTSVPHTTRLLCKGAPRWGHTPGPACSRPVRERHRTTSRPPTVLPYGRLPARMSREAPTTNQLPEGRAPARLRASAMSAGRASRQVGVCAAQSGPRRRRSGGVQRARPLTSRVPSTRASRRFPKEPDA
jgi:hypothetical protein